MVATTHWLASAAGMAVLEDGGNAFDAAVVAGFVMQVVEPTLNGPGGEVSVVFATAADPQPRVLCGQGFAPAAATGAVFTSLGLEQIPGSGLLAATVPGAWDGWLVLLRDYGTKSLREVLRYAMGYARSGYPVSPKVRDTIAAVSNLFEEHWLGSAELWLGTGAVHRNPALADCWERVLREAERAPKREAQIDAARRVWYQGFVAETVDLFCRTEFHDSTGRAHAGLLTGQDMADWSATVEDAATVTLGEWTLAKCGLWSQGPVLLQTLALLQGFTDELSYVDGVPTAHTVHVATECAKLAFADREAHFGDSAVVTVADLLAPDYLAARRVMVGSQASTVLRQGSPGGVAAKLADVIGYGAGLAHDRSGSTGEPTVSRTGENRGDTVHLSVVDASGNIVSATPSGGWLQSSPTIPELGFCLGTRAQMFWVEQGLANSVAPGKRPRTTLTPSLALRDGQPVMAFGTPGGDQQEQWQLCFWLACTVGGHGLQAAAESPTWHTDSVPASFSPRDWRPGGLVAETRLGADRMADLTARGHQVLDAGPWGIGQVCAVARDPNTGLVRGAVSPRGRHSYTAGR